MSALTDDQKTHAAALALSLAGADPTLPRSPTSTVAPSATRERGRRALEALRALSDPGALVDEGVLGQGGMGVVTLARQVALDRQVAVKRLKPGVSGDDASGALLAEARLTGALEHPGILPVYTVTREADGRPALVMKRIEGRTWSRLLEDDEALSAVAPGRGRLEAQVAIALQVCNALHFAHSRGVVHRDVKPDNVMVGAFGEVYLMDWGIAAEAGVRGQLAGTPAYMAPEMLGGDGVISPRTDVYLLGSVLHQVLSGRPPHASADLRGVMESVLASTPRLPPDAPAELVELVTRCMSADPARRPESALSVRLSLEGFLQHQGSRELAAQAAARLDELVVLLSTAAPDAVRGAALFGECRFGFQQALRTWPGNASARAGLEAALTAMARHELARGSWRAAEALMAELPEPPPALAAALDEARELDPRTGRWDRPDPAFMMLDATKVVRMGEATTGYAYVANGYVDATDPSGLFLKSMKAGVAKLQAKFKSWNANRKANNAARARSKALDKQLAAKAKAAGQEAPVMPVVRNEYEGYATEKFDYGMSLPGNADRIAAIAKETYATENLSFLTERQDPTNPKSSANNERIYKKFIDADSPTMVNIGSKERDALESIAAKKEWGKMGPALAAARNEVAAAFMANGPVRGFFPVRPD